MFLRNEWYMAGWAAEIGDKPLARRIANEPVVLFRQTDGRAAALRDRCSHRGVPLSLGRVVEDGIECGYHGMVFDGAGTCVSIPGQETIPPAACISHYAVVERDGVIWLWLGDPAEADSSKIIDLPWHRDGTNWPHAQGYVRVEASYELLLDNLMDLTHLGYVHRDTIGSGNRADHSNAETEVHPTENGVRYTRWLLNTDPPATYLKVIPFKGKIDRWQQMELVLPAAVLLSNGGADVERKVRDGGDPTGGFQVKMLNFVTPETERSTHYFYSAANGFSQDDPQATQTLFDQVTRAFMEDKQICEAQQANLDEMPDPPLVAIKTDHARTLYSRKLAKRLEEQDRFFQGRR